MMGMALTEKNTTTRTEPESQAETVLADLAETLRWDEAPKALRAVLPLARLLRRVSALRLRQSASPSAGGGCFRAAGTAGAAPAAGAAGGSAPLCADPPGRPAVDRAAARAVGAGVAARGLPATVARAARAHGGARGGMDAALARSIEAALLTLAMQPRR